MSIDDTPQEAFDASIAEILAEWGQPLSFSRGQLATAMETLYRAELEFPPTWPEHRRETFITNHADLDVGELSTQLMTSSNPSPTITGCATGRCRTPMTPPT